MNKTEEKEQILRKINLFLDRMDKTEKKAEELSKKVKFFIGIVGSLTALVLVGLAKLFFEFILK